MTTRSLVATSLLVSVGFVGGVVLTGRLVGTSNSVAQTPSVLGSTPATSMVAGQGMPDLSSIAERAVKASANISSTQVIRQRSDDFFEFFFNGRRQYTDREALSLGSGVVVSEDGYILTNNHVLAGDGGDIRAVKVTLPGGRSEMPGTIVGRDTITDLALVKVDAKGLDVLPWGDSDKVRLAEWVLAVGNPFEFNQTVTLGIISAIGRTGAQLGTYGQMLQTDAAINPGNSGGALINARGELIGINTMIYSRGGGSEGLGFAIPSNLARRILNELRTNGQVAWGTIADVEFVDVGVNPEPARRLGITSNSVVLVYAAAPTSAAARAGLRQNDVVLAFNGQKVVATSDLQRLVADAKIGSMAELELIRDGQRLKISVPVATTQQTKR